MLERSPSSISREVKRNSHNIRHIYYPNAGNKKYLKRRKSCPRKKLKNKEAIEYIKDKNNVNIPSTTIIYRMIRDKRISKVEMIYLIRRGKLKVPSRKE